MLVKVDDTICGKTLLEDVILPNGTKLLPQSTILTQNHLQILKKYNIQQLQIDQSSTTKTGATFPRITVELQNNNMKAVLRIEPTSDNCSDLIDNDLRDVLSDANVIFGIDDKVLDETTKKWHKTKTPIEVTVAQGIAPTPAKEGDLEFTVKYLQAQKDIDHARNSIYCWEVAADPSIPIERVDSGMVVARREIQSASIPGYNLFGDEITSEEIIRKTIKIDEHIAVGDDLSYKALTTGLAYYCDETLGILPLNFDGYAEVSIAQDKMKADLIIHRAYEGGRDPTAEEINTCIRESKICFGLDAEKIDQVCKQLGKGTYPPGPVTIATGQLPVHGADGKIEYNFPVSTSLKPKADALGNVDFKNISLIKPVKQGDIVATRFPPGEGTPGKDIFGTITPEKEGVPVQFPAGINTGVKAGDDDVLIALADGNVRLNHNVIEVTEGFIVSGDIDFSTGNINYEKSVTVNQDVKSGFSINCGGDCEVGGTIEDAQIFAGGSLLCRHGFIGQGRGLIECKGDVNIGFIKNQTIRCYGNVTIAHEAMNAKIFSKKTITVEGKNLSIAGGHVVAYDSIVCRVVGNTGGTHTVLEVGLDFTLLDEVNEIDKKIAEISENRNKCIEPLKKLEKMLAAQKKLPPANEALYTKLKNVVGDFDHEIKSLEDKKRTVRRNMLDYKNAFVKVESLALPGTVIKIGDRHFQVREKITGPKTIRMVKFEITVV